jgi:hypothetical protein
MGRGGFSMEPDNPLLDDFVLSLSRRQPARVCLSRAPPELEVVEEIIPTRFLGAR